MNVSEAIRTKRAIRKFQDTPLADDVIHAILNAGRRSQSSKNQQAWQFIVVRDKDTLQDLSECGPWAGHLAGAAVAIAILTPDPTAKFQTMFDAGQAAAFMQLAAWELGVGSVPASIYEGEKAREILQFPSEWHLRIALSFGYPLEEERLTAAPKKGGRRSLEEMVHWERWGGKHG
ncbi:MAG TPA: nitroreductase family protein [Anaerolineales bacterium]|nr:nitroreductase family protein [Anaerolineales bacterium]